MVITNGIQLPSLIRVRTIPAISSLIHADKRRRDRLVLDSRVVWLILCLNRKDESK
jgi:hypothetical protein